MNDMLRPGGKLRLSGEQVCRLLRRIGCQAKEIFAQKRGQAERSKAHSGALKELPARHEHILQMG
jgi:hypothetical protein